MNFRFKNITQRFYLQVLLFIVYLVLVFVTLRFYSKKSSHYSTVNSNLDECENILNQTQIAYSDYMVNIGHNERFILGTNITSTDLFFEEIQSFIDSINSISSFIAGTDNMYQKNLVDSLLENVGIYSTTFEHLMHAFRDRGSESGGNLAILKSASDRILNNLIFYTDSLQIIKGFQLKELEDKYLIDPNKANLENINYIVDDLMMINPIEYEELAFNFDIHDALTEYKEKLRYLNTVFVRLGKPSGTTGLIPEMENQYKLIENIFAAYKKDAAAFSVQKSHTLIILCFSFIVLLSLGYIATIVILMQKIRIPLINIVKFTFNLAKGRLLINPLDAESSYEFSVIAKNLNQLWNALKEKKKFVDNLLKQKFKTDLSLQGKSDAFGKTLWALKENMRKARDEQIKNEEENKLRRFLNEGIAKFAEVLRTNSDDFSKLTDEFIKELVKYLGAIQGGLFLYEEDDDTSLYLVSAFAYNRKKYLSKTVVKGEGLIGACALEKKYINLSDIPEEYIEITSGLGEASPTNLLLLPVMKEDNLIGVIELAALKKFDEYQVEVGQNIASSLASSIIATKANERTAKLLEKSQQQAAEMAEQEEEMRQNMEELKATQEESARREEDLEGFLKSINEAFYQLQYDTEGKIINVNEKLLFLLDKKADQVIGKSHSELFGKGSKADSLLFANISEGNVVELDETIQIKKKTLNIKNTFSPIKNKEGLTKKILNIITVKV
ncbi:MAG: GAF domain-containing protein [Bacteroidales bacterium]|nr:GAF domain-containing protein [Bacteroidales bacterium]